MCDSVNEKYKSGGHSMKKKGARGRVVTVGEI
jgi:hypothetical protein